MTDQTTYDLALVLDAPATKLDRALPVLERVRLRFASFLQATDIMFLEPVMVVCLLRFVPGSIDSRQTGEIALAALEGGFRLLKPMLLSAEQRAELYEKRLGHLAFRELDVKDVPAVFARLRSRVSDLTRARDSYIGSEGPVERPARHAVRLPVTYEHGGMLRSTHTANFARGGMFVETEAPPPLGWRGTFILSAVGHTASAELRGVVAHVLGADEAERRGVRAGFGVRFNEHSDTLREKLSAIVGSIEIPVIKRVMVVDDDRFFRDFFGNVLKWAGFEVLTAVDGRQALARLVEELVRLDVLVVDLGMPEMNGRQLIASLRAIGTPAALSIIVVTATAVSEEERQSLLALGVDAVVHKKAPAEEILASIEASLAAKTERLS